MGFLQKFWNRALIVSGILLLAGCGIGGGNSQSELVILPPGPTTVHLGETLQFSSTRGGVIWNVIGSPETGTIDPFGLYQAPDLMPSDPKVSILGQQDGDDTFAFVELTP